MRQPRLNERQVLQVLLAARGMRTPQQLDAYQNSMAIMGSEVRKRLKAKDL